METTKDLFRGGGSQLAHRIPSKEIAGWIFYFLLDGGGKMQFACNFSKGALVIEPLGIRLLLLRYSMLMHRQENPLAHKRAP